MSATSALTAPRAAPLVMLLAGGTGGHIYPALALARVLRQRGYRLRWIGTRRGLESRVVGAADIPLHVLPMRGLRGRGALRQLTALPLLLAAALSALVLLLRYRPALVIGMGGYASVPAALAAWLLRRPLLLHEQNAVAGSANRALARLARVIATGFPQVLGQYPQARYLGNPVREELLAVRRDAPWHWNGDRDLRVLVLGGSLGARPLNAALPELVGALGERCAWWQQCGPAELEAARAARTGTAWRVEPYIDDMAGAYAWADLVICRAGALTVAELAVCGRPALLVPLPHAIDDHQTLNARFLADAGAAVLLAQAEFARRAAPLLQALLKCPARLRAMAAAARALGRPEAANAIVDCAEGMLR